ncbi:C40 family peptidase [Metabacillus iocasae]|uniref:Cell wall-associated NlpC family hydrolase n=1 Tax=Priestia iocasae TaxID=2291674 RepID=A0ABS2QZW5_9BACI|nr:C40 family peptidase [Metabacillus iocasae]MBM7704014.1 cell wall-associated NlpC family hydrolase [Metabacillus iocasae]
MRKKSLAFTFGALVGGTFLFQGSASASTETIEVKSGDSLWGLARTHQVPVSELRSYNKLTSDTIYVGQKLSLPSSTNQVVSKPVVTPPQPQQPTSITTYKVKNGDSLWGISKQFDLSVTEVKTLNNMNSDVIYVNQELVVKGQGVPPTQSISPSPPPVSSPVTTFPTSLNVNTLLDHAKAVVGVPYQWGGSTTKGFDCSGFIYYVLSKQLPNEKRVNTVSYWNKSQSVSSPQPGDFVFFSTYASGPSHMGIYIGNGSFIHAGSSTGVTITKLDNSYWKSRYLGAKRYATN